MQVRFTAGVHPGAVEKLPEKPDEVLQQIAAHLKDGNTVAVGEVGLDYCRADQAEIQAVQRVWFHRFIELARTEQLPLVLHIRDAHKDALQILEGGYPSEIVEQTLEYVKGFHYIDDVRYARTYMEYRKTGRSLRQMERELYQKGISRADFQKASEEMEAPDEEQQVRQWIVKKRFDAETADRQERDRLIRFLLRRGYGMAVIQRVLRGSEEIE